MTGITRGELERRLARHLTEEGDRIMATTDIRHQQELLESRLSRARRDATPCTSRYWPPLLPSQR